MCVHISQDCEAVPAITMHEQHALRTVLTPGFII